MPASWSNFKAGAIKHEQDVSVYANLIRLLGASFTVRTGPVVRRSLPAAEGRFTARGAFWGNVPNLVDPETGTWGKVLLDPINVTQTTTLANLNTLGSLIAASFTVGNNDWRARFFKAATPPSGAIPKNTLEATAGIARAPWARPKEFYTLWTGTNMAVIGRTRGHDRHAFLESVRVLLEGGTT